MPQQVQRHERRSSEVPNLDRSEVTLSPNFNDTAVTCRLSGVTKGRNE